MPMLVLAAAVCGAFFTIFHLSCQPSGAGTDYLMMLFFRDVLITVFSAGGLYYLSAKQRY